jgi:hypothetical protein
MLASACKVETRRAGRATVTIDPLGLNAVVGYVAAPVIDESGKPRALNRVAVLFPCCHERIQREKECKRLFAAAHPVSFAYGRVQYGLRILQGVTAGQV